MIFGINITAYKIKEVYLLRILIEFVANGGKKITMTHKITFTQMKRILLTLVALVALSAAYAQSYQNLNNPDKVWGRYCYRELNGRWYDAQTFETAMTSMPTNNDMVLAYYYRIPAGNVRADVVWQNTYGRFAKVKVKVVYPHTGQVLGEGEFGNTEIASKERTNDLFGNIRFPADDFYRIELTTDNWAALKSINYFNYYRDSSDPVLIPRNFGGTSAFLGEWGSTDPEAPDGKAYDWAYIEAMVPWEHIHSGTYYMVLGTPKGYMGMQTNAAIGTGGGAAATDFQRNVLFSQWDAENQDEGFVPEHKLSKTIDGNLDAVHTHAGGEGSSASFMFQSDTKWWRHDHWMQFLMNTRPITVPVTIKDKKGNDSTFQCGYTVMTTWYKCDTMPEWRYIGTIRAAGICENLGSIYQFIEPFTSACGQERHRVYYRNCAFRAANSGRWYHRNNVSIGYDGNGVDRRYHLDIGRGASQDYSNCFFLDMGGYVHQHDSSNLVPLAKDMTFCDTINTDALGKRVDQALANEDYYNFNLRLNKCAPRVSETVWEVVKDFTNTSGDATAAIDGNESSHWETYALPTYLSLKASEPQTITSFEIYWTNQYASRMHFADIYTSTDGKDWQLAYDSLVVRCLDRIEVNLPKPITTQYVQLKFHHKYVGGNSFNVNEITFRGAWNTDKLEALAQDVVDNAGTPNNFYTDDVASLANILNTKPASATAEYTQALADALYALSSQGTMANCYNVGSLINLAADHSYYIRNAAGLGTLCATDKGQLGLSSGPQADMGNALNNWLILHDERYAAYYLYNVGAGKFLNTTAPGYLSAEPQQLQARAFGKNMYFNVLNTKNLIGVNPDTEGVLSIQNGANDYSLFTVFDNLHMQQPAAQADSLYAITEPMDKAALYKAALPMILQAPVGVVGGFASEEAREALQAAYDDADANPLALIDAVEGADVIEFDPANTLYRIKSTDDAFASAPYVTADASMRIACKADANSAEQIWQFSPRNQGYTIGAQGTMLAPLDNSGTQVISLSSTPAQAGTYAISQPAWGQHFIGPGEFANYVVNATYSPMRSALNSTNGSQWYLEPVTETNITSNSTGVGSLYYSFGVILLDGLSAYAVNSITPDGVIKLADMGDSIPAFTPVIIKGEPYQKYTLTPYICSAAGNNDGAHSLVNIAAGNNEGAAGNSEGAVGNSEGAAGNSKGAAPVRNLLLGTCFKNNSLTKGTFMTISTSSGKSIMKKPAVTQVGANQAYLPITDNMPYLTSYTFDFEDIIDHVTDATAQPAANQTTTYGLNGLPATNLVKGHIYIRNHKKIIGE